MKTIIVGYDGSPAAQLALERAARLAQAFGSKVVVATVKELQLLPTDTAGAAGGQGVMPVEADQTREEEWAERLLSEGRSYLERHEIDVEIASTTGRTVEEIVDVAEDHHADLIIVGTHKPGLFERLYRGSVSEGIARKAHCDVLVVHPDSSIET